jgi:hypothetical protein
MRHAECFARFYAAYPRKQSRGRAEKNWNTLMAKMDDVQCSALTDQMIAAIAAQSSARKARDDRNEFVPDWPHPGTWLSDRRWLDDVGRIGQNVKVPVDRVCRCGSRHNVLPYCGGFICSKCYLERADLDILREAYKRNGLARKKGESSEAWQQRMVAIVKQGLGRLLTKRNTEQPRSVAACRMCGGEGRYKEIDERDSPWMTCGVCDGRAFEREPGCDDE